MTTPQQSALLAFAGRLAANSLTAADQALFANALANIIPNWTTAPDALGSADPFSQQNVSEWYALLYPIALGLVSGGGGGPVVPASWLVPAWFIDPINGLDTNNGTTVGTPLKTWAQLINLYGTTSPTLRQNTTITFLNPQSDNTDPVIFRPTIGNGAVVTIVGALNTNNQVAAGVVLGGTVAKNRTTGQFLNTNLGASGAVAQLVQNTTAGKFSFSLAEVALGGNVFQMTQPLSPQNPPVVTPTEVDTWANGDTVTLWAPFAVNIVAIQPTIADANAADTNQLFVQRINLTGFAPGGLGSAARIGPGAGLVECVGSKALAFEGFTGVSSYLSKLVNTLVVSGAVSGNDGGGGVQVFGGATLAAMQLDGVNVTLDFDFIISAGARIAGDAWRIGAVGVDTATTLTIAGRGQLTAAFAGVAALYGAGSLAIVAGGRLQYPSGAGQAVATLLLSGGITINGGSAHSVVSGSPDVLNGGITVTAAHLDAAAGAAGFGGNAFVPGGGAIANTG